MITSGTKIFLVIIFVILLFKDNLCFNRVFTNERNIFYSVSDTTRGREEKTTKTRVPKDKKERESKDVDSGKDDFWGSCFSTCLFNFFFGNGETEEEKTEDEITEEDTIKEEEKKNIVVEEIKTEEDLNPQKKLSTPLDWNKVNGQLKIGFGIWYKIF